MNDINLLNGFYKPSRTVKIYICNQFRVTIVVGILSYIGIILPLRDKQELSLEAWKSLQNLTMSMRILVKGVQRFIPAG